MFFVLDIRMGFKPEVMEISKLYVQGVLTLIVGKFDLE